MNTQAMYHRSTLNHLTVWVRRFRKRKGYGVHSPAAFYLIRFVFFEKAYYYDYARLEPAITLTHEHYRKFVEHSRLYKLLFRMVNDAQPSAIWEIGRAVGLTTIYLAAPCKRVPFKSVDILRSSSLSDYCHKLIEQYAPAVDLYEGDVSSYIDQFVVEIQNQTRPFLFFRAELFDMSLSIKLFEKLISIAPQKSVLMITGIHSSKALNMMWRKWIRSERVGVTFDLYELGVVYFDHSYLKQNYLINF